MTANPASQRMKAAEILFRTQVLSHAQYDLVVRQLHQTQERSEEIILENDLLSEADLLRTLSTHYRTQFVSAEKLSKAEIPKPTVLMIPRRFAETKLVFPVVFDTKTSVLSFVTCDPDIVDLMMDVKTACGAKDVRPLLARPGAILAAIKKHHDGDARAFQGLLAVAIGARTVTMGRELELGAGGIMQPSQAPPAPSRSVAAPPQESARAQALRSALRDPLDALDALEQLEEIEPELEPIPEAEPGLLQPLEEAQPPVLEPPLLEPLPLLEPISDPPVLEPLPMDVPAIPAPPRPPVQVSVYPLSSRDSLELFGVLVSLLENGRQELRGHSSQVGRLGKRVLERLNVDKAGQDAIIVASFMHDLGKSGQFHLTALNAAEHEGHAVAAQRSYATPVRMLESVTLPKDALLAVTHMYERFDGKGFPNGLAGNDIPLAARVLSVADTYADLTQNPKNPFRKVLAIEDALEELEKRSKTLFDPDVVDIVRAIATGTDLRERLLADRRSTLLIDADYEETTVLELRMIEQAFDVRVARTVENAKKLLQEERGGFDLVVSEIDLPDGDGLELLAYVKREPWGKDVPWMVHTRRSGGRDAARAFELGAVDFLAKPTASDVLVAKAKALLEERSQKRTARGVAGSLSEMTLPDIVQIIFHGKKTGKLNVRSDGQAGEIHFMSGHVANAVLGQLRGPDAFYAMMGFTHGDFGLDPTYVPSERVIHQSSEALLLEGMRRLDESLR